MWSLLAQIRLMNPVHYIQYSASLGDAVSAVSADELEVDSVALSSVLLTRFPSLAAGCSKRGSALPSVLSSCFWQHCK